MQAGRLRHIVTIERRRKLQNTLGADQYDYVPFIEDVRALVLRLTGTERLVPYADVQGQLDAQVEIRYRPGIKETMRVRWVSDKATNTVEYFAIVAPPVALGSDRRKILLLCREYSSDGNLTESTKSALSFPTA